MEFANANKVYRKSIAFFIDQQLSKAKPIIKGDRDQSRRDG